MRASRARSGFALLPVVLALAVLAAVAFALSRASTGSAGRERAAEDADQAALVAEAGLRHALWLAGEGECRGYGLPDTAFGDHLYQATFQPTAGSPVSVTAVGSLASGASYTLVRDGQPVVDGLQTHVASLPTEGADTHLDESLPDANFGGGPLLGLAAGGSEMRPLLQFDLSVLPIGAHVIDAELSLHLQSASGSPSAGGEITAHPVTRSWQEGTKSGGGSPDGATWNDWDGDHGWDDAGGDLETAPVVAATSPSTPGSRIGLDLARVVQQWVDESRPNHGVVLRTTDTSRTLWFASGNASSPALRPRLVVLYGCECGGGSQSTQVVLSPGPSGEDTTVDSDIPGVNLGADVRLHVSDAAGNQRRGLLRFDLSGIDASARVASAHLELNLESVVSGATASIFTHRALTSWEELQATWIDARSGVPWTSPGGDFEPTPESSADVSPLQLGRTTWDVTAMVADWVDDPAQNHGVFLVGSSGLVAADFSSSDAAAAADRPKLTVRYACECGPCGPPDEYLDQLNEQTCDAADDFAGSDGTLDWAPTPWERVGELAFDTCSGGVQVSDDYGDYELRFGGTAAGLKRPVDLSMFSSPGIEISYLREALDDSLQALVVEASPDGLLWTEIGRVSGPATDLGYKQTSFDLTPFATATAAIRLMGLGLGFSAGTDRYVYVDDVRIRELTATPTLQITLSPDADTFLRENDPTKIYGDDDSLTTGVDATGKRYRTMIRFDVGSLPAGSTVVSAMLRVYAHSYHGNQDAIVELYRVTDPWDEATASWNSTGGAPFDPASPLSSTLVVWDTETWKEWSVPVGLIHEWMDGVTPNYGLLLEYAGTKNNHRMSVRSRERGDVDERPQLVIEYELP